MFTVDWPTKSTQLLLRPAVQPTLKTSFYDFTIRVYWNSMESLGLIEDVKGDGEVEVEVPRSRIA